MLAYEGRRDASRWQGNMRNMCLNELDKFLRIREMKGLKRKRQYLVWYMDVAETRMIFKDTKVWRVIMNWCWCN